MRNPDWICRTHPDEEPINGKCRPCNKEYQAKWFAANKEIHRARTKASNAKNALRNQTWVLAYLRSHPCSDCGETDPVILEFDHVKDKEFSVSQLIRRGNLATLIAEIAKCEVVCANCHRRRTARQFSWYKQSDASS